MTANNLRISAPSTTIWGRVQHRQKLAEGVYSVETASHEGVVVSTLVADRLLSKEAQEFAGCPEYGWYHFEGDDDVYVFINECYDICPQRWQEMCPDHGTPAAEALAERRTRREEARRKQEAYEARKAKEDSYRQQLTGEWDCEEKTFTTSDDITVVARKTDKPDRFMCKILVGDKEAGCLELDTDLLLTLLMDCKKKTE